MLLSGDRSDEADRQSLSFAVIEAVAEREGIDPVDLTPPAYEPLYAVVDPEALDALFLARTNGTVRSPGSISFEFCDYDVTVTSEGDVTVSDLPSDR